MQHNVAPALGPNCFQRLSLDDTSRQRVNGIIHILEQVLGIELVCQNIWVNMLTILYTSGKCSLTVHLKNEFNF